MTRLYSVIRWERTNEYWFSYESPMPQLVLSSRFFMAFGPFLSIVEMVGGEDAMSFDPNEEQRLRDLQKYVGRARTITPGLMIDVIVRACVRFQTHDPTAKARVFRLIENGAFADATLGLLELDLPQWKLRRLIFGDGEWHCSLSKQLALPSELDQMAGGSHESLPLAILSAFIEARHSSLTESELQSNVVEQFRPAQGFAVCCDNFG